MDEKETVKKIYIINVHSELSRRNVVYEGGGVGVGTGEQSTSPAQVWPARARTYASRKKMVLCGSNVFMSFSVAHHSRNSLILSLEKCSGGSHEHSSRLYLRTVLSGNQSSGQD